MSNKCWYYYRSLVCINKYTTSDPLFDYYLLICMMQFALRTSKYVYGWSISERSMIHPWRERAGQENKETQTSSSIGQHATASYSTVPPNLFPKRRWRRWRSEPRRRRELVAMEVRGERIWEALADGGGGKQWWRSEIWEMGEGSGVGQRWVDVGACAVEVGEDTRRVAWDRGGCGGGQQQLRGGGRRAATVEVSGEDKWGKFMRLHLFLSLADVHHNEQMR
jgi:hypothetical protein